jgi:hypothetical protein
VVGNDGRLLNGKVDIVDAELVVEPRELLVDEALGDPPGVEDDLGD